MPELHGVFSSHIEAVGHDPATNELIVRWKNGRVSAYAGVSAEEAAAVRNARSVGEALRPIKARAEHRYV